MVVKSPAIDGAFSEEALTFAREHRIMEHAENAMRAAREVFSDAKRVSASLARDPEFGDVFIDVHVVLSDDEQPETEPQKYHECLAKWASLVPPQSGGLIRISTSWEPR